MTSLYYVENVDMARILVEAGAYLNPKTSDSGGAPLFYAIADDKLPLARFLFEKRANPHIKDNYGKTPPFIAKRKVGFFDCSLRRLIKDFESYTPAEGEGEVSPVSLKDKGFYNPNTAYGPGGEEGPKPAAAKKEKPKASARGKDSQTPSFPPDDFDISP